MANSLTYKDRVRGMLLGLHAGDALGAPIEFQAPRPDHSLREIIGGGEFNWRPGQPTDDTELMLFVLKSMPDLRSLDLNALRSRLIEWHDSNPPDIGNTTRAGIKRLKEGEAFGGRADDPSESNGSIMRVAPLAILDLPKEELHRLLAQQAALTHGNPNCAVADQIFVDALRMALSGASRADITDFILNESRNRGWYQSELEHSALCSWSELPTSGRAVHTLGSALWALNHAGDMEGALIKIVNRGDDSDTAGAVVGAMFGALEGSSSIPRRWLEKLEETKTIENEIERLL